MTTVELSGNPEVDAFIAAVKLLEDAGWRVDPHPSAPAGVTDELRERAELALDCGQVLDGVDPRDILAAPLPNPEADQLREALPQAFITCSSESPRYFVTIKTPTLQEAQKWHDAVLELARQR